MKQLLTFILLIVSIYSSFGFNNGITPLPDTLYLSIDNYARKCPESIKNDLTALVEYLQKGAKTDIEKARVIYVWITDNINYDQEAFNTGKNGDYSAEGVLESKNAICEGFSNLFYTLGIELDLEIEKVHGYAKGYSYIDGMKFQKTNHAWNIIKIDGKWKLFDATWGQGYGTKVNNKLVCKKEFDSYWFDVDPYEAIFNHLPEDLEFEFVKPSIKLSTFEKLPNINKEYFKLGFNGKETYNAILSNITLEFPKCYNSGIQVKAINAPKNNDLMLNANYQFEFYIPMGIDVAIIDSQNNWTYFNKNDGVFKVKYTPKFVGEIKISIRYENEKIRYYPIMTYDVKKKK
ncbi:MAG: transglutaminase domain-containing protein [Bacteroidales bacterium]